ncbi:DNA polymerase III subunit delta' [Brevundimonas sp.]|uniref:DNA polymerase III subunit delta' n=1 Tax=Brevundimonas sp. TaxID=1871086 RepID=UPI00286AC90A|nr:DNA polymerase III subunit delta' [Brevundimonas sp.]
MSEHPRDRFDLVPSPDAELAFLDALDRGRLHHAWLICGPEGLGKATFAYRAARRLLGAAPDPSRGPLGARPSDPVSQLVTAQSHPDLLVLERLVEGGKTKKSISVDQARDLPDFFSKSPSRADYRVAIIDAADDLNLNAANALLKVLEEPPERGVLFLVTHAPGRLLATIRSRCRRLTFQPWPEPEVAGLLARQTGLDRDEAVRIAGMARGSPGAALSLATTANLELDRLARRWVDEGPVDRAEALSLADGFRGAEGQARFEALMDRLAAAVKARSLAQSGQGAAWADLWTRLTEAPERAAAINLDKGDLLAGALADLARVKRMAG